MPFLVQRVKESTRYLFSLELLEFDAEDGRILSKPVWEPHVGGCVDKSFIRWTKTSFLFAR